MDGRAESSRTAARTSSASPQRSDTSMSRSRSRSPSDASMASTRSRSRSASPTPRLRRHSPPRYPSGTPSDDSSRKKSEKTALHITHLTSNVRESHLRHIFGWYGDVLRIHLTPSRSSGEGRRDAWAYVMMGSVEHAAKAALYMSGGQIDGAIINIRTCEVPADLPPEQPRERSSMGSRDKEKRRDRGRDNREGRYGREHVDNRRDERRLPPPRAREWGSSGERGGVHPDRQRMINGVGSRRGYDNDGREEKRQVGAVNKMRRWGQRDQDPPSSRRGSGSGRRNRSRSRSRSPPLPGRRRSFATTRASPTY